MKVRFAQVLAVVVLSVFVLPCAAFATESGSSTLVDRSVTTVSGAQLAEQVLQDFDRVEFGSDSATVWLSVDGVEQAVDVRYADVLSSNGLDGGSASIVPVAMLFAVIGGLLRFVRVLTRLAR